MLKESNICQLIEVTVFFFFFLGGGEGFGGGGRVLRIPRFPSRSLTAARISFESLDYRPLFFRAPPSSAVYQSCHCTPHCSRSKLGEGILREPRTVSILLSLLLDRRAPPKLVLIVLKLCRCALPLMSAKSCGEVTLPSEAMHYLAGKHGTLPNESSVLRVATLLLAKLGDFVLPSADSKSPELLEVISSDESDTEDTSSDASNGGMMSLYLHKRHDQPAHEVVQKVLRCVSS